MNGFVAIYNHANQLGVIVYALLFVSLYVIFWVAPTLEFKNFAASTTDFLRKRRLFVVDDVRQEEMWLNLLRVVAGFVILDRAFHICIYEILLDPTPARLIISTWSVIAASAIMMGFLTPIFMIQLFLLNQLVFDQMMGTFTLGSCVQQILLLIFLFTPAGRNLSIDSWLMRRGGWTNSVVSSMYQFFGHPTINRVAIVKFGAFLSYGLLCTFSVYGHFHDPNWTLGTANVYLLTSNWLTGSHELFRYLFAEYQVTAVLYL